MGKTAWAINIAENAAVRDGKVVAVFFLEMSKESLLRRMLASQALVSMQKIQTGFIPKADRGKLMEALERLAESKIFIDDTPAIALSEMRAKARRLQRQQGGLDLIVIDYLQLMTASTFGSGFSPLREPHPGGLRHLARAQSTGQGATRSRVAFSQLSRASEQRGGDKKPMLSDLRESGSIEQDADVVAFIHRDSYYNKDENGEEESRLQEQGGDHHRQAAQRAHRIGASGLPRGLHALREHGLWGRSWRILSTDPCGLRSRAAACWPTMKSCALPVGSEAELIAVVKANAYGHDVLACAPLLAKAGALWLGVTDAEEGAAVRAVCPQSRILLMSGILPR